MTDNQSDIGARLGDAMQKICDELPARLAVRAILLDAHKQLVEAVESGMDESMLAKRRSGMLPAIDEMVSIKVAEVMHEIATIAVEEFTNRTGQPFLWKDEPEYEPEQDNIIMSFHVDENGVVGFGEKPLSPER